MAVTRAGVGSDYGIAYVDSKKQPFDGSKTYKLRIPANPPAEDFWALTIYDNQTRSSAADIALVSPDSTQPLVSTRRSVVRLRSRPEER